jgi:hypothetical protein
MRSQQTLRLRGVWIEQGEKSEWVAELHRVNAFPAEADRSNFSNFQFQFQKRSQLFILSHNEALTVAMRVSNPDRSPVGING